MHEASCHCGQVRIRTATLPPTVTECNCSICRRYGALWAYYLQDQVEIAGGEDTLASYSWGDRTIGFRYCRACGCLTHYESLEDGPDRRIAVNARMWPLETLRSLTVRHFDGNDSWTYLD